MTKNESIFCGICKSTINNSEGELDWIACEYCGQVYHGDHILNYEKIGFCPLCSKSLLKGIDMNIYKITGIDNGELEYQAKRKINRRSIEYNRSEWTTYFYLVIILHILAIGWLIIWGFLLIPLYGIGFILLAIVPLKIWLTRSLSTFNKGARKIEIFVIIISIMIFDLPNLITPTPFLSEFIFLFSDNFVIISMMSDYGIFQIPFGFINQNTLSFWFIIPIFQLYVLLFHQESVKMFHFREVADESVLFE